MKERLKREYEEEINVLMEENNKLEDDYEEVKVKVRLNLIVDIFLFFEGFGVLISGVLRFGVWG